MGAGAALGVAGVGAPIALRTTEARSLLLQAHTAGAVPAVPSGTPTLLICV